MLLRDRKDTEKTEEQAFNDFQSWIEAPPSEQVMHTIAGIVLRGYKKWPDEVTSRWLPMAEGVLSHFPKPVGCPQELLMDYAVTETPFPPFRLFRLLRLVEQKISPEEVSLVFGHPDLCHIDTALLIDMHVDDAGLQALLESVSANQLKILDLQHNKVGDMGAMLLASSTKLAALTHLSLFYNHIGEGGLQALLKASRMTSLQRLSVGGQQGLPPATLITLLQQAELPASLIELRLEFCDFRDEHLPQLAAIESFSQLEALHLSGNEVSAAAVEALAAAPHLADTEIIADTDT